MAKRKADLCGWYPGNFLLIAQAGERTGQGLTEVRGAGRVERSPGWSRHRFLRPDLGQKPQIAAAQFVAC